MNASMELFRPFKYPLFRRFLLAEFIYRSPIWMVCLLLGVLAQQQHPHSTFYQGMIGFLYNLPILFLGPLGGALADAISRILILRWIQVWYLLSSLLMLGALYWAHSLMPWILACALITGMGFGFSAPALNAIIADLITNSSDLAASIGVFTAAGRMCQFVGYAVGGLMISWVGVKICFMLSALLYVLALMLLCTINVTSYRADTKDEKNVSIKHAVTYSLQYFPVRLTLLLTVFIGALVWPYVFQMPLINAVYLHGSSQTLGALLGVGGGGGLVGGMVMMLRRSHHYLTRIIAVNLVVIALMLIAFSLVRSVTADYVVIFILDFALSVFMIVSATFLQQLVTNDIRGRIMSFYSMAIYGMVPVGCIFFYGTIGEFVNVMHLFLFSGCFLLALSLWYITVLNRLRGDALSVFIGKGLVQSEVEINKL